MKRPNGGFRNARLAGFGNLSSFNRAFRRRGLAPGDVRGQADGTR
jgi:AraC-like DNA-binding protein